MTTSTIDHLSHSQIQSFTSCPRKWHYEKVQHAPKERVGSALIFGITVHDAIAAIHEAALDGSTIDAAQAFTSSWQQAISTAEAPICFGRDDADDLHTKGLGLVGAYAAPAGIIGVEQPCTVELAPDLPPITGRIDLIRQTADGQLVLADVKTSSAKALTDTAAVAAQLGLYDLAYPAAQHEVIVLGKLKSPTITIQSVEPTPPARLVRHYQEVYHAMQAGVRYAVRGWACESCPYACRCRADG